MLTIGDGDKPPPIEFWPSYSIGFVAHLHGGCFAETLTPQLSAAVRRDPIRARLLDALTITQMELRALGGQ